MELSRIVEGKRDKLFSIILESITNDIQSSSEETISVEEIYEGFSYYKILRNKFGKQGKTKVTITQLDIPNRYEVTFKSAQGVNTLSYRTIAIDETHFELTYKEDFISEKKTNNMNYSFVSWFYKRSNKKKANLILNNLETMMKE